ncbi:MAG: molybdopterin-dependent oxidoreductase [Gemmatimonadota bacterium]|nr:MAG: molybdopterin-dependent oxidoreductase [Gemmatimonadota bacterium]
MTTTHQTTCPLDCPDSCALDVTVGKDGLERIDGSQDRSLTAGFICGKVRQFGKRLNHQDRVLYPLRRVGRKGVGEFERITWDEAVEEITERFSRIRAEWGSEAIVPYHYGGSNGLLTDGFLDSLYFARLGASRLDKTLCAAPTTNVAVGMYGKMPGVAFEDYVHAKCIIVWGANPKASNIHLVPFLKQAKARGAFIAVVDPVRNLSAQEADLHLAVRPGTDLPVALALIKLLQDSDRLDRSFIDRHTRNFEPLLRAAAEWPVLRAAAEAGVAEADIRRLADVYADASPAVVRCGWGLERNRNGGQAVAAVLALPALTGKFGVRGGGYTMSNNGAATFDSARLFDISGWHSRVINMTQLGAALNGACEPPIKALFVYNCNPAITVPDQANVLRGLLRDDLFTVVHEQVMTDTANYADIVLPATTFLEHRDVRVSYGNYVLGGVRPVMDPMGEALSNPEMFARLGQAMGFTDAAFGWDEEMMQREVAGAVSLNSSPVDASLMAAGEAAHYRFPERTPIQFETVHPLTAEGIVDLSPAQLGERPYTHQQIDGGSYPLQLISPASGKLISSTFGEFNLDVLRVMMHPVDADSRGIAGGDTVRVHNDLGEVVCDVTVSEQVRVGVACMPKGAWLKSSHNGLTASALCPAHVNVVGGGACYNDAWVEIEKTA